MPSSSRPIGVRRTSYPSGPWVDAHGNPARSPNNYEVPEVPAVLPKKQTKKTAKPSPSFQVDSEHYIIVKALEVKDHLIIQLKYPNCTNYEGNKILVYENTTLIELVNQKIIDPHFCIKEDMKYPVARFVPTEKGWNWAVKFAQQI